MSSMQIRLQPIVRNQHTSSPPAGLIKKSLLREREQERKEREPDNLYKETDENNALFQWFHPSISH